MIEVDIQWLIVICLSVMIISYIIGARIQHWNEKGDVHGQIFNMEKRCREIRWYITYLDEKSRGLAIKRKKLFGEIRQLEAKIHELNKTIKEPFVHDDNCQ